MPWLEALLPVRMRRVAIVAPQGHLRDTLVALADAGTLEIDALPPTAARPGGQTAATGGGAVAPGTERPAARGAESQAPARPKPDGRDTMPRVLAQAPSLEELRQQGRWDLVAGEEELERVGARALKHRSAAILVGWTPQDRLHVLAERLAPLGTSVVELPDPAGGQVPTLITGSRATRSFRPLVDTYGPVPYADIDPTLFAGFSYLLMFGMMFGDVAHGLILAALGLYLRQTRRPAFASLRGNWAMVLGAGLAGALFGLLYGEAFGPTGIVPPLWLAPMDQPVELIVAGVIVGAGLLALSYLLGTINRWREGGSSRALYASTGIAGASLYLGAAGIVVALLSGSQAFWLLGAGVVGLALLLLFVGYLAEAGGGWRAVPEALIELVDGFIRTAANAVSFARLAAFGLTHAAIGGLVWTATAGLWASGGTGLLLAVTIFLVGNVVAFALEALVAAVQALRLEYYELFSRIFAGEGRVFAPWHLPVVGEEGP
jgi:V/A-type H+/Na+-transporting ATPase subunit I